MHHISLKNSTGQKENGMAQQIIAEKSIIKQINIWIKRMTIFFTETPAKELWLPNQFYRKLTGFL